MLATVVGVLKIGVAKQTGRLGCVAARLQHTLPDLPYDYNALEPHLSADIMQVHHGKHHATYVNNLNATEGKVAEAQAKGDHIALQTLLPALSFNAGGHFNHSIFWQNMSPNGGGEPTGDLLAAIKRDFGSFDAMKTKLSAMTTGIQGSGWGWLACTSGTDKLQLTTSANQELIQVTKGLVPLYCIDVWEHAYYLQYKNVRADFVNAIWNLANWKDVSERFSKAKSG